MPWRFPWSENIKKRSCRYLLQRYLGQFLKEKLTLEQLSIDIYEGTGHIKDILLDVEALNELGAANNLPFEFVDGFIGDVRLSVPWSSLLTASSHVEISRLLLTVRAKPMHTDAAMFDSMLDSMSASTLDLAKECLAAPQGAAPTGWGGPSPTDTGAARDASETLDGIEALARAIDSVLLRIKVRLLDTTIRLEHVAPNDASGVGLELRIERADYMDEAGRELMSEEAGGSGRTDAAAHVVTSAMACKRLTLHGVSLHCDEFPSENRRWPGSMAASFAEQKSFDNADEEYTPCRQTDGTAVPVLIARLHCSTVLGWQVKLDDSVPGPKMSVHMTSSSLCSLLSPRQFHGLSSLLSGFVNPQTDHSRDPRRPAGGSGDRFPAEKPMTRDDYQLIEEQLMRGNLASRQLIASSHALSNQGWSGNIIDDDDDEYVSLCRGESGGGAAAATYMGTGGGSASDVMETSGVSSLMSGSVYSESTRSEYSQLRSRARRRRDRLKYEESGSDSIQFRVQLATVAVSLLHDDVLTTDPDAQTLTPDSCKQMDVLAESFLRRTSTLLVGGFGGLTSDQCRQVLLEACPLSHISLVAAPMKLECSERPIGGRSVVSLRLDCGRLEVLECLVENIGASSDGSTAAPTPVYTELMMFDSQRQQGCSTAALTLTLRHSQLSSAQTAGRDGATSHVAVRVTLAAGCQMEVDPSLVDRVSALLYAPQSSTNDCRAPSALATPSPRPADQSAASAAANQQCFNDMVNDTAGSVSRVDLQVSCSAVDIRLRIPVADLRPPSDMSRAPWWRRCVRPDSFHLLLEDACLSTSWPPAAAASSAAAASDGCSWRLELQAREMRLAYSVYEDERSEPPLVFMQATSGGGESRGDCAGLLPGAPDCGDGLDWPRLVMTGWPYTTSLCGDGECGGGLLLDERSTDSCPAVSGPAAAESGGSSPIDGLATDGQTDPSPFSRRRVVYDTDAHSRGDTDPDATEGDELTVPADRVQVNQFIDNTMSNCHMLLDFCLPCVQALLPSKQFYDNVYNRLSNDLALWEPSSPLAAGVPGTGNPPACRTGLYATDSASLLQDDPYQMCRSATQYDSDSGSDADGGVFYSVYEQRQRQWRRQRRQDELIRSRQSRLCCRVRLERGTLALHTPTLDDDGLACSDHHGEMQLFARSGSLFVVTGYGGVYNHGYVCVAADSIQLYHKARIPTSSATAALPSLDSAAPYLQRIVYPTDCAPHADGGDLNSPGHDTRPAMLSVSVKYQLDDTNNIKTFTVAVGLHGCTLRYLPVCTARHLFFNQLIDMLDTRDIVVPGYCVPATVTELHLQISQSAVDYRPVSLPYRYLVTADSLTISSHLVTGTSVSVLRVILEEAALHVSPSSVSSSSVALPQFVCVLDAGLLELSVRMCDVTSEDGASGLAGAGRLPGADWRVNNNRVRLRTCADSLRAVVRLLTHLTGGAEATTAASTPPAAGSPSHQLLTPITPETRQVPQQQSPATDAVDGTSEAAQRGLETMLEDAMLDTSPKLVEPVSVNQGPVEVFFFPNEPHVAPPPPAQQAEDAQPINTVMASMAEALADMDAADCSTAEDHEGFCVLEDDLGVGIRSRTGEPQVRCLSTASVRLVENHFPAPTGRADVLRAPVHFPVPRFRFTLQHLSLSWCMFGGHDLPVPVDGALLPRKVRIESPPSSPSSTEGTAAQLICSPTRPNDRTALDTKHDSLHRLLPSHLQFGTLAPPIGESGKHQRRPSCRHRLQGGPHRQQDKLMELKLTKVRCQYERYPDSTEQACRVVLTVHDVEILDRLASSDINKFLYQYSSENCLRQAHTSMLLMKALVRRPDPSVTAEECDVRVSGCPVRLNVDQDALFFLRDFFLQVTNPQYNASSSTSSDAAFVCAPSTLSISPRLSEQPVSSATTATASAVEDSAEHPQTGSTAVEVTCTSSRSSTPVSSTSSGSSQQLMYFRAVTFSPEMLVRIDYRGRRVDVGQFGPLVGLIVGLGQLNCCEIRLKRICHRTGVLGVERLLNHVFNEWLTDIRRNQLPSLLGGIGPMHCFLQLFQGVRDLVWLPIEQYRKDGRIVKGLQRGANSFSTSTAMALLELTSQLVGCIQCASELAYDMLTPGPTVRQQRVQRQKRRRQHRQHQLQQHDQQGLQDVDTCMPHDLREGVNNAYQLVKEGLGDTAQLLVRVASLEHDQKGVSGAVGGVLRQIPPTVVTPLLLVSQATGNVLGGMRNQLAPDARREALDKWKTVE